MIDDFSKEEYHFLSNFCSSPISYGGRTYPSVEHFFQAMKTKDDVQRRLIAEAGTPGLAKKMGRSVVLREDWNQIKLVVMAFGIMCKFNDPDLKTKLVDTYPHDLVEGNWWGDDIWGVDIKTGQGRNYLGQLLMILRAQFMLTEPIF